MSATQHFPAPVGAGGGARAGHQYSMTETGEEVGTPECSIVGMLVGIALGALDGASLGVLVGESECCTEGELVGEILG